MQFKITVIGEHDDKEVINDLVKVIELTAPYMTDNVVVTCEVDD
jgi:hypothetical protein